MSLSKCFLGTLVLALAIPASSLGQSFSDDFEGNTLDPFWNANYEQAGSIVFPSADRAHGGTQSLKLESYYNVGQKGICVGHEFTEPTYGTVTVWMYDTGADVSSSNYMNLQLIKQGAGRTGALATMDYDHGPGYGGEYNYIPPVESGAPSEYTTVDRTQGWHEFTISILPNSATFWIDGVEVYAGANPTAMGFDLITLNLGGPYWRPAFDTYFDDFEFVEYVENPFTVTDFGPPLGKKKKLGSTLPVKFQLFVDDVEMQSPEDIQNALGASEPVCPKIVIYDVSETVNVDLPEDEGNVGEGGDLGDCFRYSDCQWIFNLGLPNNSFFSGREYAITVDVGDIELTPGNNLFEIK